jgi:cyanate permease
LRFSLTILHGFAFGAITTIMLPVAIQLHSRGDSYAARMGWYTAALSAGYALGSFLSGAMADSFGFSLTFFGMGMLPLGTILLTLMLPEMDSSQLSPSSSSVDERRGGMRGFWHVPPSLSPTLLFATLIAFYINFLAMALAPSSRYLDWGSG